MSGQHPVGERLPARRDLAKRYGVAPETVKRALDELQTAGLVASQSTRGMYVLSTEPTAQETGSDDEVAFRAEVREAIRTLTARIDAIEAGQRNGKRT